MITEKEVIKCEAIFNEDRTHRYLWKRVWDKDKPLAAVVMLNPCLSDNIVTDTTTTLVVNNVARLESYGGVVIVNLYSLLTTKLNFRWNSDEDLNDKENDAYIKKAAEEASTVILAWGKSADTNQRIQERAKRVLEILAPYKDKLTVITDGVREGLHPLTPILRQMWELIPYREKEEQKPAMTAEDDNSNTMDENSDKEDSTSTTALEV